jgi:hypothetical protein
MGLRDARTARPGITKETDGQNGTEQMMRSGYISMFSLRAPHSFGPKSEVWGENSHGRARPGEIDKMYCFLVRLLVEMCRVRHARSDSVEC